MSQADAAFIGAMPEFYDRYIGPVLMAPYAADMAARLSLEAGDILEIAAGTGFVTRALLQQLPDQVKIVATDLNQPMLDRAAERITSDRITWQQADAQELPFEDSSFDAAVCQFGVMFFPDREGAYRETLRVIRPGGSSIFNAWDKLEHNWFAQAVMDGLAEHFPDDPPRFMARTPHGYHDVEQIASELSSAGFADVQIETVIQQRNAASHKDPAIGMCQGGPMRNEIEARDPDGLEAATEAAARKIAERFGTGAVQAPMQAHVVSARRP
jgi:ubiquinone/menaquinone biosynthesis C-methylase UbiE